jgi:hypothetical protein
VTGNESRKLPLPRRQTGWEGAADRTIRKPEDLPTLLSDAENRQETGDPRLSQGDQENWVPSPDQERLIGFFLAKRGPRPVKGKK